MRGIGGSSVMKWIRYYGDLGVPYEMTGRDMNYGMLFVVIYPNTTHLAAADLLVILTPPATWPLLSKPLNTLT